MTRNKRLRRRINTEKRRAEERQQQREMAIVQAKLEANIAINLGRKPARLTGNSFQCQVFRKAPKLAQCADAIEAVRAIKPVAKYSDISAWKPQGKSAKTQFLSFAEFVFPDWTLPKILWSAFWSESCSTFKKAVISIARGYSLHSLCKSGDFPVALTKKQCHELLHMPAKLTLMEAVRLVQIKSLGGDKLLFQQWWQTAQAKCCHPAQTERYWQQCLSWIIKNRNKANEDPRLFSGNVLAQLFVYLDFRHNQDKTFGVKGRSVDNVLMDTQKWHKEQALLEQAKGINLPASGFQDLQWQQTKWFKKHGMKLLHWQVKEIRSKSELLEEGNAMRHCVYSYKRCVEKRSSSIWALTCNGQRGLTIEVRNRNRQIVQIKGKGNREANALEQSAVDYWAKHNELHVFLTE